MSPNPGDNKLMNKNNRELNASTLEEALNVLEGEIKSNPDEVYYVPWDKVLIVNPETELRTAKRLLKEDINNGSSSKQGTT